MLFVGAILAVFGSLSELCMHIFRKTKSFNGTFKRQLIKEVRFALQFKQSVKEVESEEDEANHLDQKSSIFVK